MRLVVDAITTQVRAPPAGGRISGLSIRLPNQFAPCAVESLARWNAIDDESLGTEEHRCVIEEALVKRLAAQFRDREHDSLFRRDPGHQMPSGSGREWRNATGAQALDPDEIIDQLVEVEIEHR